MDYFRRGLEEAQKQAAEAAARARLLAQSVGDNTRVLAKQASDNTRVLAKQASDNARVLAGQVTAKTRELAAQASTSAKATGEEVAARLQVVRQELASPGSRTAPRSPEPRRPAPEELARYGITDDFVDFLRSLTYGAFRDFGDGDLADVGLSGADGAFRLDAWQVRHAELVLQSVKELEDLRYVLCPRRMEESRFWHIYFTMAAKHLPREPMADGSQVEGSLPGSSGREAHHKDGGHSTQRPSNVGNQPAAKAEDGGDKGKKEGSGNLSDDAELDAYLENVLNEDGGEGRSAGGDFEDLEDFDDYLEHLNSEADADTDAVEVLSADVASYQSGQTPTQAAA